MLLTVNARPCFSVSFEQLPPSFLARDIFWCISSDTLLASLVKSCRWQRILGQMLAFYKLNSASLHKDRAIFHIQAA